MRGLVRRSCPGASPYIRQGQRKRAAVLLAPLPLEVAMTRREEAAKMLHAWREAEATAVVFERAAGYSERLKTVAETCRREANDLLEEILQLMGVDTSLRASLGDERKEGAK